MLFRESADVPLVSPVEIHLQEVLAIHGEVVTNRQTASRAERQILAPPIVLPEVLANRVLVRARCRRRVSNGEPAHFPGRREVALEQQRRDGEDVRNVVEPVTCVVATAQGSGIDVY